MKLTILDASVAIKWFVKEEIKKDAALAVLKNIESHPKQFAVPELFFNEMLAVFCKLQLGIPAVIRNLRNLEHLGFYRIGNGSELLARAATLAVDRGLTGYDAVYAACAQLTSGVWLTADEKAHRRISGLGISKPL